MEALPTELVALVVQHCTHNTQKQLRLVNKALDHIASPILFEHFYMALFGHSLENLQNLARSPLAKHIKSFTFYCNLLPRLTNKSWEELIDHKGDFHEWMDLRYPSVTRHDPQWHEEKADWTLRPRHNHSKLELATGWAAYEFLYQEQQDWRRAKELRTRDFKETFAMLPNVTHATAFYVSTETDMDVDMPLNELPLWKRLSGRMLIGPTELSDVLDSVDLLDEDCNGLAAATLLEGIGYRTATGFGVHRPVTDVRLKTSGQNSYGSIVAESKFSSNSSARLKNHPRYSMLLNGFRSLTTLNISVNLPPIDLRAGSPLLELQMILRHATGLRRLRIGNDNSADMSQEELQDIHGHLSSDPLPSLFDTDATLYFHLEALVLAIGVPTKKLLKFLRFHASTLKSLDLVNMCVGEVPLLLQELPRILSLEQVYIENIVHTEAGLRPETADAGQPTAVFTKGTHFQARYEIQMEAYLLRKTDKMPDIAQVSFESINGPRADELSPEDALAIREQFGLPLLNDADPWYI